MQHDGGGLSNPMAKGSGTDRGLKFPQNHINILRKPICNPKPAARIEFWRKRKIAEPAVRNLVGGGIRHSPPVRTSDRPGNSPNINRNIKGIGL